MPNLSIVEQAARSASSLFGQPLGQFAHVNAIDYALQLDEAALFGTGTSGAFSDLLLAGITTPATPVITPEGTVGSTSYSYIVVDVSNVGAAPSAAGSTSTGNATLSATNYNQVAFNAIPGHTYQIIRSASSGTPSSTGLIGTYTAPQTAPNETSSAGSSPSTYNFNDTGITATTVDYATLNSTGSLQLVGPAFAPVVFSGAGNTGFGGKVTLSATTGQTLTAAQMFADVLIRTGSTSAAFTDTTPTAAALVSAAGPGARAGMMHRLLIRNECATYTQTIGAGSGVTLRSGNTNTIATANAREFWIVFTTLTVGSEAIEIITGPDSAY